MPAAFRNHRAFFLERSLGVQFAAGRHCGNCFEYRPRSPIKCSVGVCATYLLTTSAQTPCCDDAFAPIGSCTDEP